MVLSDHQRRLLLRIGHHPLPLCHPTDSDDLRIVRELKELGLVEVRIIRVGPRGNYSPRGRYSTGGAVPTAKGRAQIASMRTPPSRVLPPGREARGA